MLQFPPKKEEDLIDLLSIGIGQFEVMDAKEKNSKNGNPMIELVLKVWDENGTQGLIYDYLMMTDSNFSLRKILHFCKAAGLLDQYEKGLLTADHCKNKFGNLKIGIQKDKDGKYPDKNVVNDYLEGTNNKGNLSNNDHDKFDDDIPF